MAIDPRKRQKQLARKAAKRKARLATHQQSSEFLRDSLQIVAANSPVHESLMSEALFERGLGHVVVSRRMGKYVTAGFFLVDVFCLGVKDAFLAIVSQEKYEALRARSGQEDQWIPIDPTCARKLVEGAVAYAGDLGFAPHKDYQKAKTIFGDISADVCPASFEFGKDNMPFFIAGPYDTPSRCEQIIDVLTKRCGPGGFHYLVAMKA